MGGFIRICKPNWHVKLSDDHKEEVVVKEEFMPYDINYVFY
ncbi:MAG: hypothetical protein WCP46_03615 [Alphaproteobacteria bacterium]|jgi:hypothetical protein